MTITIDAELEARLRAVAAARGEDPIRYAIAILTEAIERDEAAMHEGIRRGLADEATGRVKPPSQVVAEARERHGFPSSWPDGK